MPPSDGTYSRHVTIVNVSGLHARCAASMAVLARKAQGGVWIRKGSERVDAKDVMDILSLGCQKDSVVTLSVENSGDMDILNRLAALVEDGFEE